MRKLLAFACAVVFAQVAAGCRNTTASSGLRAEEPAAAAAPAACPAAVVNDGVKTLADLRPLSHDCLESLFSNGRADASLIPSAHNPGVPARGDGISLIMAGGGVANEVVKELWSGKIFTTKDGRTTLVNTLGATGLEDVSAEVSYIPASMTGDNKPSILLDYSKSNRISARPIRDELRLVGPGLYLGKATVKNLDLVAVLTGRQVTFVLWFALSFAEPTK